MLLVAIATARPGPGCLVAAVLAAALAHARWAVREHWLLAHHLGGALTDEGLAWAAGAGGGSRSGSSGRSAAALFADLGAVAIHLGPRAGRPKGAGGSLGGGRPSEVGPPEEDDSDDESFCRRRCPCLGRAGYGGSSHALEVVSWTVRELRIELSGGPLTCIVDNLSPLGDEESGGALSGGGPAVAAALRLVSLVTGAGEWRRGSGHSDVGDGQDYHNREPMNQGTKDETRAKV